MSEPVGEARPGTTPTVVLVDAPGRERYELRFGSDDGPLAAFLEYRRSQRWISLLHTEVLEEHEGRGIGSRMAEAVFDDARRNGLRIIAKCPFIVRWLERHPEQHDMLLHPPDQASGEPGAPLESP